MQEYINELLKEGNVTLPAADSSAFLSACALRGVAVEITDACDYDGQEYERYDIVL